MFLKIINKGTNLNGAQSNQKTFHIQRSLLFKTQCQAKYPIHKDGSLHSIQIS